VRVPGEGEVGVIGECAEDITAPRGKRGDARCKDHRGKQVSAYLTGDELWLRAPVEGKRPGQGLLTRCL
jgi:hypothetical protein